MWVPFEGMRRRSRRGTPHSATRAKYSARSLHFSSFSARLPARSRRRGEVQGFVTTQAGAVRLPGAEVTVKDASDRQVAQVFCEEDGHFRATGLPAGQVSHLRRRWPSSRRSRRTSRSRPVGRQTVSLDLPIAAIAQTVEVVAPTELTGSAVAGTLAPSETIGGRELDQFAPTGGVQASLRLLASIIEVPGGVSIKGGRPSQAGMQLGPGTLVDPSTGLDAGRRCPTTRSIRWRCCRIRTRSSTAAFPPASSSSRRAAPATSGRCGSTTSIRRSAPSAARPSRSRRSAGGRRASRRAAR